MSCRTLPNPSPETFPAITRVQKFPELALISNIEPSARHNCNDTAGGEAIAHGSTKDERPGRISQINRNAKQYKRNVWQFLYVPQSTASLEH